MVSGFFLCICMSEFARAHPAFPVSNISTQSGEYLSLLFDVKRIVSKYILHSSRIRFLILLLLVHFNCKTLERRSIVETGWL